MLRRRSNSSGLVDDAGLLDRSDPPTDLDDTLEEPSISSGGPDSPISGARTPNGGFNYGPGTVAGVGPVIPSILQRGTVLTKVTKKKRKTFKYVLDIDAAKVCWDPSRPNKRFYIDDIREIRTGADARNYREEFQIPSEAEPRWFTILYADEKRSKGRPIKTMHLIAPNEFIFDCWTTTLRDFSRYRMDMMTGLAGLSETSLRALWNREMSRTLANGTRTEQDERLNLEGVERLCLSLHIVCSKNNLRYHFAKADKEGAGSLDFGGFKDFIRGLKERRELKEIFSHVASDQELGLDKTEFMTFLRDTQSMSPGTDPAHWNNVFERYAKKNRLKGNMTPTAEEESDQPLRMNFEAFTAFLMSASNSVLGRTTRVEPLDRPLGEYFISSSHNTYLLGRQVAGESSTEAYIWALQRGCRCVEVDCWDGPDGRPLVNHGRTLTSSVLFSDCIAVIGKYAFSSTPYPLIISLEVHCSPEQQIVMAEILGKTLEGRLLSEPFITNSSILPSPEALKNRILIKVKAAEDVDEAALLSSVTSGRRHRSASSPSTRSVLPEGSSISSPSTPSGVIPSLATPPRRSVSVWANATTKDQIAGAAGISISSAAEDSDPREGSVGQERRTKKKKKPGKIVKRLGDLGVYTRGQKYADFDLPESKTYNHVFSFSERAFENLCRDAELKTQLEQHNQQYLMRVYPAGYRINSSNFDPNKFWRRGVQMVALNWQTYDLGVQMNDAMFAAGTDRTGYVLKPRELRQPMLSLGSRWDSLPSQTRRDRKLVKFYVDIISAQQLPRPRGAGIEQTIDPYVELEIFCADDKAKGVAIGEGGLDASARNGMSGIGSPHRRRTKIVQGNGYNPLFNDKFTVSLETKFPSLVFLRWTVWSSVDGRSYGDRNGALASFTAKLESLQEGYRHLPLFDNKGEQFLFATLFCRIKKDEPVPVSREDVKWGKVESLKSLGRSVFGRATSMERKKSLEGAM